MAADAETRTQVLSSQSDEAHAALRAELDELMPSPAVRHLEPATTASASTSLTQFGGVTPPRRPGRTITST